MTYPLIFLHWNRGWRYQYFDGCFSSEELASFVLKHIHHSHRSQILVSHLTTLTEANLYYVLIHMTNCFRFYCSVQIWANFPAASLHPENDLEHMECNYSEKTLRKCSNTHIEEIQLTLCPFFININSLPFLKNLFLSSVLSQSNFLRYYLALLYLTYLLTMSGNHFRQQHCSKHWMLWNQYRVGHS